MSSYTRANYRQPFEKTGGDPTEALERLRRLEIRLWVERHAAVAHYLFRGSHNGSDYGTTCSDDDYYPEDRVELARLDRELENIFCVLYRFYHYSREYSRIICHHTWEFLPVDWEGKTHDGFGHPDPTICPREPHL